MDPIYTALTVTVWFLSTYFISVFLLLVLEKRSQLNTVSETPEDKPYVSIIVPAYNEEEGVLPALESLCRMDYPRDRYEVLVINDGSSDRTADIIRGFISRNKDVRFNFIDRVENRGKAYSLNEGVSLSKGELVGTMDADSMVKPDILSKTVGLFEDPKTAAVTVRVHVHEPRNLLEKIVDVEYVVGLSLTNKILSFMNAMHVTPGPFSIYRKSALDEVGGFDEDNIVEDMEIAFRLHKAGYGIENTLETGVYTIVPQSLGELYKQRKRWYSGSIQTWMQHRDVILNRRFGCFGMFFIPINCLTITLGMVMGLYSFGLLVSAIWKHINYLILTNFEVLPMTMFDFDLLNISIFHFLMLSSMAAVALMTRTCLNVVDRRLRSNVRAFIGFIFFFILYQVFWVSSFYSVFFGREVKWR